MAKSYSRIIAVTALLLAFFALEIQGTQLILRPNRKTCTVLVSSFDPIKVETKFPTLADKMPDERFRITLTNLKTGIIEQEKYVEDRQVFRQNYNLQSNLIYDLCFEFVTSRKFGPNEVYFMGFVAEEHFQSMIGKLKVPPELTNDKNLKSLFSVGSEMNEFNGMVIQRQKRERQLEDRLVDLSSHKSKRIFTMTVIECGVIILSGVYQIFALRKILIEKNLY